MKKIFVGNLSFATNDATLRAMFETYGAVSSATVMTDGTTGRSRGFGFVEMNDDDAAKAITALNGSSVDGRALTVNEARPKTDRGDSGRGGGRRDSRERRW